MKLPLLTAAFALFFLGCSGDDTIRCHDAAQCRQGGIPGTCEASPVSSEKWCAFTDPTCDGSMRRWGVASGDGLAGQCVAPGEPGDGGISDATLADAAPCVPDTTRCEAGQLLRCDASGHALPPEACSLACISELSASGSHCAWIEPRFVAGACSQPTAEPDPQITQSLRFDTTSGDCAGGVVVQPPNHPDLCVLRYSRFTVAAGATFSAVGSSALAIVVDGDIDVAGSIDVGAHGSASGAGGGATISGTSASGSSDVLGSGGAGFSQAGGAGGGVSSDGTGPAGGAITHPENDGVVAGGPRGGGGSMFPGGGGGGGITLVSCKGTVRVTGTIGASGGGGTGGHPMGQFEGFGGGGGGAGGEVVLQGTHVVVHGQIFANGGGGGSGSSGPGEGSAGQDGSLSASTAAAGGPGIGSGGSGGAGGLRGASPQPGKHGATAGGGGGSAGSLQIFLPQGVSADLAGAALSPAPQPVAVVPTH